MLLNEKEIEIAKAICHVNQVTPFPLSDNMIEDWAKSINKLRPTLEVKDLVKTLDLIKLGEIEWNGKFGIQNIFEGLRLSTFYDENLIQIRPMIY